METSFSCACVKRGEPQRNKSVEYGPATEKEPRVLQAPGKLYSC